MIFLFIIHRRAEQKWLNKTRLICLRWVNMHFIREKLFRCLATLCFVFLSFSLLPKQALNRCVNLPYLVVVQSFVQASPFSIGATYSLDWCWHLTLLESRKTLIFLSQALSVTVCSVSVWGLHQGFFAPGEPEDPPEEPHGREAVHLPASRLSEGLQQLQRPGQTPAHTPGHGQSSATRVRPPPKLFVPHVGLSVSG